MCEFPALSRECLFNIYLRSALESGRVLKTELSNKTGRPLTVSTLKLEKNYIWGFSKDLPKFQPPTAIDSRTQQLFLESHPEFMTRCYTYLMPFAPSPPPLLSSPASNLLPIQSSDSSRILNMDVPCSKPFCSFHCPQDKVQISCSGL